MRKLVIQTLIFALLLTVSIARTSAQTDSTIDYRLVWQFEHDHRISLVKWRPQSDVLAVAAENSVILVSTQTGKEIRRIEVDEFGYVGDMAWNRDGNLFAAGDTDRSVHIYDEQWEEIAILSTPWLLGLAWHPLKNELLTANDSETSPSAYSDIRIIVWSPEGEIKGILTDLRGVGDIEFSPDGKFLVGASGGEISGAVWDAETYDEVNLIILDSPPPIFNDFHFAQTISWSPDSGQIVLPRNDNTVRIFSFIVWDTTTEQMVIEVKAAEAFLYSLSWHPELDFLAIGSGDGTVSIWDMQTYENVLTITEENSLITSVAWSPDGKFLAVADRGGTVKLWQIDLPDDQ